MTCPKQNTKNWRVIELIEQGIPIPAIAERTGRSKSGLYRIRAQLAGCRLCRERRSNEHIYSDTTK